MVGGGTKRNEKNYPELTVLICTTQQIYQITLFCLPQSPQQAHKCVRWECRPLRELLVASGKEMARPSSVQFQSLRWFPAAIGQSVSTSLSLASYRVTPAWSSAWWRQHVQTLSPHCMSHKTWNRYFTKCQQTSWKLRLRKVKGPLQGHWARTGNTRNPIWSSDHTPCTNSHSDAFSSSETPSVIRMSSLPLSDEKQRRTTRARQGCS